MNQSQVVKSLIEPHKLESPMATVKLDEIKGSLIERLEASHHRIGSMGRGAPKKVLNSISWSALVRVHWLERIDLRSHPTLTMMMLTTMQA